MTFFDSPLGERLSVSLDSGKPEDVAAAVSDVAARIWDGSLSPEEVGEAMARLEKRREFGHVIRLGEAAIGVGTVGGGARRLYCQALIETGALHAAELGLGELLGIVDDPSIRGEALGLMGRARKQRFVAGGRPEDLLGAIDAYREAYDGGTDPAWHGVNVVALACRAIRDGIELAEPVDTDALTAEVLRVARENPPELRSVWERSTEVEALVAMGDEGTAAEEAIAAASELSKSRSVTAFELRSLRRQLVEIWQLQEHHPVLSAIANSQLELGKDANVALPTSPRQLEKIFGTELPVGYNHLRRGLECAESVAKITDASGEPWGTGFLVKAPSSIPTSVRHPS